MRQITTQGFSTLVKVLHLRRVVSWSVKRQFGQFAVGNGNVEAVTEGFDVLVSELLGLVHGVFAFTGAAHAKTFHGFDQQHGGLSLVLHSSGVCGIHLLWIMTTTAQVPNIIVAHLGHHFQGARIATKEMFAHISAIVGFEGLIVAVQGFHHDPAQCAVFVSCNQLIPVATPNEFDDVPTCATKLAFQLLNDLAVASHRTIQAL